MDVPSALIGASTAGVLMVVIGVVVIRLRSALAAAEFAALSQRCADLSERLVESERLQQRLEQELSDSRSRSHLIERDLAATQTRLEEQQQAARDKMTTLTNFEERLREQFQALAGESLHVNAKRLGEQQHERLATLLNPLRERMQQFEEQVAAARKAEHGERERLRGELHKLHALNQQMSEEATNLTKALRGQSKTRGDWGEMILTNLLERSGLELGREYQVQSQFSADSGKQRRPDVVISLPENRCLIIDSKVQLESWASYCEADTDAEQQQAAKRLAQAMRLHVKDLASKRYHDLPGAQAPDFTLMFIAIEPAFACAVRHDPDLFQEAFDQQVVLVSPTTLLATLSTVSSIWRYEHQNQNALEIAERAGRLYDKFVGFTKDMDDVGQRIRQTQDAHATAMSKLSSGRGNLVRQAEQVRKLGAKVSKKLDHRWVNADDESADTDASGVDAVVTDSGAQGVIEGVGAPEVDSAAAQAQGRPRDTV